MHDAEFGQHASGLCRAGELLLGAEELQHAAGAVIESDARLLA